MSNSARTAATVRGTTSFTVNTGRIMELQERQSACLHLRQQRRLLHRFFALDDADEQIFEVLPLRPHLANAPAMLQRLSAQMPGGLFRAIMRDAQARAARRWFAV